MKLRNIVFFMLMISMNVTNSISATGFLTTLRNYAPKIGVVATFVVGIAGAAAGAAGAATVAENWGAFKWIDNKIITNKDSGTVVLAAVAKAASGFFVTGVLPAAAGYCLLNR